MRTARFHDEEQSPRPWTALYACVTDRTNGSVGGKAPTLHALAQAAEVFEVPPDDGTDAPSLFRGQVVGSHADTVPCRRAT